MTFQQLSYLIEKHNIPYNVHLLSDSGWECDATEMDGVFYNKKENEIVFTQKPTDPIRNNEPYDSNEDWKELYVS